MTKVKCDYYSEDYCNFRGEDGYCTREEIEIDTEEGIYPICDTHEGAYYTRTDKNGWKKEVLK